MIIRSAIAFLAAGVCLLPLSVEAAPAQQVVSQLPRNARPTHYAISITPDAAALKFGGTVQIEIEVLTPTQSLTLNAADLSFGSVQVKGTDNVATVSLNPAAQTATFTFASPLKAGKATLDIAYSGKIYQQATGLFALDYKDPAGAQKRGLFTQFQAPDARRFVPSWDEPNFRTTFDLTAVVPSDQMAISNMPVAARKDLGGGKAEVVFQRTPTMSTYLLFFGLGELDRIAKPAGKTEVGIVMGKGNAEKARYVLDASAQLVPYYDDYFGVPYPLPKLDNVAGPGQSQFFSAMENWGAIFSFERILLLDPKITSVRGKQRIYEVAAHEIAHQWFGNLVTMQWWDDLWLNEGFASWMATKATAHFNPDWQVELTRVGGRETAMSLDAYATTHPVIQSVKTVEQVAQAFDSITYSKGEAVITMLEGYAGEKVWRDGIRSYIKRHAYQNTKTDDLWRAVEGAGAKGITSIAHDFTKKPGIPLIKVGAAICTGGSTRLDLTQGEFSRDRKAQTDKSRMRWNVPVIAQTLSGDTARTLVSGGKGSISVAGCGPVLINAGQSGYYRTLYTVPMAKQLSTGFGKLAPIDQLGLMSEFVQLSHGGYQPMAVALDLIGEVPNDAIAQVVGDAVDSWSGYYGRFKDDDATRKLIESRVSRLYGPRLDRLGYAPRPDEPNPDAVLRGDLIAQLGGMGDPKVLAEARQRFAELDNNPSALDGPLRQAWLATVATHASKADWEKLRRLGQRAESQRIKTSLYELMSIARDPELAKATLALALTSEPGTTVSAGMIGGVSGEFPDMAFDFAIANKKAVEELVDVSSRSEYIAGLANGSRDPAMIGKLENYARQYLTPASRGPVDKAIGAIRTRLASERMIKAGVKEWLARNAG